MCVSDTCSNHVSDAFEQKKWMSHKTGSQPPIFACLTLPQLWLWHHPPNSQVTAFPHRLQPCLHPTTLLLTQGLRPTPQIQPPGVTLVTPVSFQNTSPCLPVRLSQTQQHKHRCNYRAPSTLTTQTQESGDLGKPVTCEDDPS